MAIRVLPEAHTDLREAIRHYRAIKPPAVGKELALRVLAAFKRAVMSVEAMPLFGDVVVVAVEYASMNRVVGTLVRVAV